MEDKPKCVYFDDERGQLYWIEWIYTGNNDIQKRHYIRVNTRQLSDRGGGMKVHTDPVMEAIARKLLGIERVPPGEQAKMIRQAAKAGAEALRKQWEEEE